MKRFFIGLLAMLASVKAPIRPNTTLTPGDAFPGMTKDSVCVPGFSTRMRDTTYKLRLQVYKRYGVVKHPMGAYEIDHLIPLELGGSNDLKNLWPETRDTTVKYNAQKKDWLENTLHRLVCQNALPLKTAQQEIAHDWIAAYKRHKKTQS